MTSPIDLSLASAQRAADRVKSAGGSALDAAVAALEAAFTPAIRHELHKNRIRALMRKGPCHPEVWMRFTRLNERHPDIVLHAAIWHVERMRRAELDARDVAIRLWGRCSKPRTHLMLLDEARLMLRWLRRYEPFAWAGIRDAILYPEMAEAAE